VAGLAGKALASIVPLLKDVSSAPRSTKKPAGKNIWKNLPNFSS
jgi:hypothetical protein